MKLLRTLICIPLISFTVLHAAQTRHSITQHDTLTSKIMLSIDNDPDERLYKDTLIITPDHPAITLAKPEADHELQQWPGKRLNDARRGWQGPVTFTITATRSESAPYTARVHVSFATNKHPQPSELIIPITFIGTPALQENPPTQNEVGPAAPNAAAHTAVQQHAQKKSEWPSISGYVKGLVKSTESPWIRLLLVFILGILLSLTPCIYPMIPITIGILQSQAGDSTVGNAVRAIAYTLGMGTTYALFGLLASCTGPLCGYIFSQPLFVIALAVLLMYFGLCMFGFFEMYIPRFLQVQHNAHRGGSLLAAFMFGLISGTLASPCVSPGLALILSIVATLGNKILGFALLFAFGVGLSMPLLIVGLSAGSLHLLPRAGMWMVEIKKLFGFLLFALSFYYLSAILPHELLLWLISIFLIIMGVYYIYVSYASFSPFWKKFNILLGTLLLIAAVAIAGQALQSRFFHEIQAPQPDIWFTDYQEARAIALRDHKLLFIDVWADFCSICITINKTLLADPQVVTVLKDQFVPFKVNGTQPASEPYATIHKQFTITGFPTYLVVDPRTNEVIKRWDSKIYNMNPTLFIEKLHKTLR